MEDIVDNPSATNNAACSVCLEGGRSQGGSAGDVQNRRSEGHSFAFPHDGRTNRQREILDLHQRHIGQRLDQRLVPQGKLTTYLRVFRVEASTFFTLFSV